MTRDQALKEAATAAGKAAELADLAERAAHSHGRGEHSDRFARVGALWVDTARAFTQLAQQLPEPEETTDA